VLSAGSKVQFSFRVDPRFVIVFRIDNPGTSVLLCRDLHHASNAGVELGSLIVPVVVTSTWTALAATGSEALVSPAATDQPTHTMAPQMTEMPGMESMPGMDH